MKIAFLGSSLLSSYWNGAATYYRGIISSLHTLGFRTTFYEPDAFDRQQNRDIDPPEWAQCIVYPATITAAREACSRASDADVVVKASGIGVFDDEILGEIVDRPSSPGLRLFWDVDAPATLADMEKDASHPLRMRLGRLDGVFTYGGGDGVARRYLSLGAKRCVPVYNALDPKTHFPVEPASKFEADLAFLGNRLPDREARVDEFFFKPARRLREKRFLLAGSGWEPWQYPRNVRSIGHLPTRDHNAFNCTPLTVINIARDSMAEAGFSPATRVFEAAGAGACLITDAWTGIENFLKPGEEILLASSGDDVTRILEELTPAHAREIGGRGRARILSSHTYDLRARQVADLLSAWLAEKRERVEA